ncbi:hypothetical protein P4S70_00360 [Enterovibrio sp. Hal110]
MKFLFLGTALLILTGCLNLPEKQVWVDGSFRPADAEKLNIAKLECDYDAPIPNLVKLLKGEDYDKEEANKEIKLVKKRQECMKRSGFFKEDESKVKT